MVRITTPVGTTLVEPSSVAPLHGLTWCFSDLSSLRYDQMKHPDRLMPWQPAESRVVARFAEHLLAGSYKSLSEASDACLLELRNRQAARPNAPKSDRVYPRTYNAVRSRISRVAIARGLPKSHVMWNPVERRLAYKWARKFLRHRGQKLSLPLLDAARGLLADLFAVGHDRTLNACELELYKCVVDAESGKPRHCGRGPNAPTLPAAVLRGTNTAKCRRPRVQELSRYKPRL
jgi:hypothetical protein